MRNILIVITLTISFVAKSQITEKTKFKYPQLIAEFVSKNWRKVYKAKDSLVQIGKPAIPDLIKLMENPKDFSKLENTADLIYPGASEFYGHGRIVDYDLDWIAIRAGWALENLTFQNFGFSENVITEKELMELHKQDYAEYIEKGKHDVNFENHKFKKMDEIIYRVKRWFEISYQQWTPLIGLKEAIYSNDTQRQLNAIHQMRYPEFTIVELTQYWFDKNLRKRIEELNKSKDEELVVQTGYLLKNGVHNKKWQ